MENPYKEFIELGYSGSPRYDLNTISVDEAVKDAIKHKLNYYRKTNPDMQAIQLPAFTYNGSERYPVIFKSKNKSFALVCYTSGKKASTKVTFMKPSVQMLRLLQSNGNTQEKGSQKK